MRYVIEGGMRQLGDQLRINIQLIDGANEQHLWAEKYDCAESELFSGCGRRGAAILSAVVFSHWLADLIVYPSDLSLWPLHMKTGFGLWNLPVMAILRSIAGAAPSIASIAYPPLARSENTPVVANLGHGLAARRDSYRKGRRPVPRLRDYFPGFT